MVSRNIKTRLLAAGFIAIVAASQVEAQDVIVMRRVVTQTPANPGTPEPTDPGTGTPTPGTEEPTPPPSPTPSPSAEYEKIPTKAVLQAQTLPYASTNRPVYSGGLTYSTNAAGVMCRNIKTGYTSPSQYGCDGLPNPPSVGTHTISATFIPAYHVAVINRADITGIANTIDNADAVCSQSVSFAVAGGPSESWVVSCNANLATSGYAKIVTGIQVGNFTDTDYIRATQPGGANYPKDMYITPMSFICKDVASGQTVANSYCSNLNLPTTMLPAEVNPQQRSIYLDWNEVLKVYPQVENQATECSKNLIVSTYESGGAYRNFNYKMRCDANAVRNHFQWIATHAWPTDSYPVDPQPGANVVGPIRFTMSGFCQDTDTGQQASDATYCENIPKGQIDIQTLQGEYNANYRKAYFNLADLVAIAPQLTEAAKTQACKQVFKQRKGNGSTDYTATCNREDVRMHHRKVANRVVLPLGYSVTGNGINSSNADFTMMQNLSFGSQCVDTDNGQVVDNNTYCLYMNNEVNGGDAGTRQVSMRFSPSAKTISVRWADVIAGSPGIENKTAWCSQTNINVDSGSNTVINWKRICD